MDALLIALFVGGLVLGIIVKTLRPTAEPRRRLTSKDELDYIDEMFLYGEVNDDDFYRM